MCADAFPGVLTPTAGSCPARANRTCPRRQRLPEPHPYTVRMDSLRGSHVVVLGGAGFLGSHLCDRLLAVGARVTAVDNFLTGHAANVDHLVGEPGFRLVEYDVTDYLHVPGDVDHILHFASPASPVDYLRWPIQTLKVGSLGTHKALGLARAKGARLLLASTSEVY